MHEPLNCSRHLKKINSKLWFLKKVSIPTQVTWKWSKFAKSALTQNWGTEVEVVTDLYDCRWDRIKMLYFWKCWNTKFSSSDSIWTVTHIINIQQVFPNENTIILISTFIRVHKDNTAQRKSASSYVNKTCHAHCAWKTMRHTWLPLFAAELVWAVFEERESKKAWSANELPQLIPSFAPSVIIWNRKSCKRFFMLPLIKLCCLSYIIILTSVSLD